MKGRIGRRNVTQLVQLTTNSGSCSSEGATPKRSKNRGGRCTIYVGYYCQDSATERKPMDPKYEQMAEQMRADGASEELIARFVAKEMEEDEFRRGKGATEIKALREWRKIPAAHAQAAARQRVLPQLWHDGVRARLHAAHAPRLRAHRGPVREMRIRGSKALRLAVHGILPGIGSCWTSSAPGNRGAPQPLGQPL